jgi:23S rRNA (cytidine2498-2'-O)-methyltransferase
LIVRTAAALFSRPAFCYVLAVTAAPHSETRLHVPAEGSENALLAELYRVYPGSSHALRSPGLVESALCARDAAQGAALAFALQCLPAAEPLAAPSISAWAALAAERLVERLGEADRPWRLHVFCREAPGSEVRGRRCALVAAEALEALKKRRRRLLKARVADSAAPWAEGEAIAQLALERPDAGFFSFAPAEVRARLRRSMSRFPGGLVDVADDPRPPSRAYRKLLEAEIRLGARIGRGETCVDLGAAPGGWSHVALSRGACVVAVDRSPLAPELMAHPGLEFARGDAFKFTPERPVDWLLSDVIATPDRALDLVDRWVGGRLCRRFVVTVKFKGDADYPEVERLKAILDARGAEFEVRRMCNNKNEVTAFGTV